MRWFVTEERFTGELRCIMDGIHRMRKFTDAKIEKLERELAAERDMRGMLLEHLCLEVHTEPQRTDIRRKIQ